MEWGNRELTNQHPAWEMVWQMVWQMVQEIVQETPWEMPQEIIRDTLGGRGKTYLTRE